MMHEQLGLYSLPARLSRSAVFSGWPIGTRSLFASNHFVGNTPPLIANISKISENTDHPTTLSSVALRKFVGEFLFKSRWF